MHGRNEVQDALHSMEAYCRHGRARWRCGNILDNSLRGCRNHGHIRIYAQPDTLCVDNSVIG